MCVGNGDALRSRLSIFVTFFKEGTGLCRRNGAGGRALRVQSHASKRQATPLQNPAQHANKQVLPASYASPRSAQANRRDITRSKVALSSAACISCNAGNRRP